MKNPNEIRIVKQVIIVRTDLSMSLGKVFSQICHASMKFLADKVREQFDANPGDRKITIEFDEAEYLWLSTKFTKIALAVSSEEELISIKQKLEENGIPVVLIVDDGTTTFHGQPTATCLGVGPAFADEIDRVTRHLKLFHNFSSNARQ